MGTEATRMMKIDMGSKFTQILGAMLADRSQERKYPTEESLVTIKDALECAVQIMDHMTDTIERYQQMELERSLLTLQAPVVAEMKQNEKATAKRPHTRMRHDGGPCTC